MRGQRSRVGCSVLLDGYRFSPSRFALSVVRQPPPSSLRHEAAERTGMRRPVPNAEAASASHRRMFIWTEGGRGDERGGERFSLARAFPESGIIGGEPVDPVDRSRVQKACPQNPSGSLSPSHLASLLNTSRPSFLWLLTRLAQGRRTHSHWVVSQLVAGREGSSKPGGRAESTSRPRWTDPQADRSSWAGGMILAHVASGKQHLRTRVRSSGRHGASRGERGPVPANTCGLNPSASSASP